MKRHTISLNSLPVLIGYKSSIYSYNVVLVKGMKRKILPIIQDQIRSNTIKIKKKQG